MNLKSLKNRAKIGTPEYSSYLQVSWTKPTFANQQEPRKMLK